MEPRAVATKVEEGKMMSDEGYQCYTCAELKTYTMEPMKYKVLKPFKKANDFAAYILVDICRA